MDLLIKNGEANAGTYAAIHGVIAQMKTWVAEFYGAGTVKPAIRHRRKLISA